MTNAAVRKTNAFAYNIGCNPLALSSTSLRAAQPKEARGTRHKQHAGDGRGEEHSKGGWGGELAGPMCSCFQLFRKLNKNYTHRATASGVYGKRAVRPH